MKHLIKSLTLIIAVTLMIMPLSATAFSKAEKQSVLGQAAPDFTLTDTNGVSHRLSDYLGNIVVLEWTNHQCPYVMKHYDSGNMQTLQKEATEDGVIWLSVASSALGKQGYTTDVEANKIIRQVGANASDRLLDPTGEIGHLYGAKTTPHMFVINAEGTLVYEGAIDDNPSHKPETIENAENYVRSALADIKAGTPVKTPQSKPYGCAVKYKRM